MLQPFPGSLVLILSFLIQPSITRLVLGFAVGIASARVCLVAEVGLSLAVVAHRCYFCSCRQFPSHLVHVLVLCSVLFTFHVVCAVADGL